MTYQKADPDKSEWTIPKMRGFRFGCCDCGLIHDIKFRIVKHHGRQTVAMLVTRNNRATATARRSR